MPRILKRTTALARHSRIAAMLVAAAAAAALSGCRASPHVVERYGLLILPGCDTTLKRPLRPAELPDVPVATGYGSLTGIVFRLGAGNGIDSASIILSPQDSTTPQSARSRLTGQTGGFAFDSVVPGRYRLRAYVAWEHPESSLVSIVADRIDTVRIPMRAPGFCARS